MKKLTLLIVFFFFIQATLLSQGCLPDGIVFLNQTSIDNFQTNFPGCSVIEGYVVIIGDDITNVNGLSVLDSIYGKLEIKSNPLLENLSGLDNLKMIGQDGWDDLMISDNESLISFEGLESLKTIKGDLNVSSNPNLSNFSGLDSLTTIGDSDLEMGNLLIQSTALTSLSGLENLISIAGDLRIGIEFNGWGAPNPNLTDISALENLTSIGQSLRIGWNESLVSLSGLENVTSIGWWLQISENNSLTNLSGLDNIDAGSIGYLTIESNELLSTCEVQSICEYLAIPNAQINIEYNATGCNSQEEVEDACEAVGIDKNKFKFEFSIYPNPATNELFIESKNGVNVTEVNIYNPVGQIVFKQNRLSNRIDISTLNRGLYFVELVSNEMRIRKKLIVK